MEQIQSEYRKSAWSARVVLNCNVRGGVQGFALPRLPIEVKQIP